MTFTHLTAANLSTLKLSGSAVSKGNDEVSLVSGTHATDVTNSDSKLDLAPHWNTTEWDVFGDGGGTEAYFGAKTTLEAETTLVTSTGAAPVCKSEGFTAETNNLKLTSTPAISASSPTMASKQTNGATTTASCATAS